jgi:hypothetical protein
LCDTQRTSEAIERHSQGTQTKLKLKGLSTFNRTRGVLTGYSNETQTEVVTLNVGVLNGTEGVLMRSWGVLWGTRGHPWTVKRGRTLIPNISTLIPITSTLIPNISTLIPITSTLIPNILGCTGAQPHLQTRSHARDSDPWSDRSFSLVYCTMHQCDWR